MLVWNFAYECLLCFMFSFSKTLSGDDVPTVESIDSQISDVDPQSRTWGRRVVMLNILTDACISCTYLYML